MSKRTDTSSEPPAKASATTSDTEVERELLRESAEGSGVIGDMNENRNLSGSSTWQTLLDSLPSVPEESAETF